MKELELEVEDKVPLQWPEDRSRTRFQDRKQQNAWKLSYTDTMAALEREMRLSKVTFALITHNTIDHEDSGVAVWMSRKPMDDYAWQDEFGFIGTIPTVQELDRAYMQKARKVAPDSPTPNIDRFRELTRLRDQGRRWIRGERTVEHESVMASDRFKETRHNLNAIRLTLAALRQIERCGDPQMTEQAWRGFRKQLSAQAVGPSTGTGG
jgi:hypothetical protein